MPYARELLVGLYDDDDERLRALVERWGVSASEAVRRSLVLASGGTVDDDEDGRPDLERAISEAGGIRLVAEALGVTEGAISHWRTGRRTISVDRLAQIRAMISDVDPSGSATGAGQGGIDTDPRPIA